MYVIALWGCDIAMIFQKESKSSRYFWVSTSEYSKHLLKLPKEVSLKNHIR